MTDKDKQTESKLPQLYGFAEFGKEIGWDRKKLRVYFERGKLPEPATFAGNRPFWTKGQVDKFKKTLQPT